MILSLEEAIIVQRDIHKELMDQKYLHKCFNLAQNKQD